MSRKIQFRIWNTVLKKYVCPNVVEQTDGVWLNLGNEDNLYEFEQYTGLKDKNGKEIYDGDIFINAINGGTWLVYWNEKNAAFWVDSGYAGCSLGEFDWDRNNKKCGFIRKNCEVIGNIHENGDLLK